MNSPTVEKIKLWIFPSLMSMIGLFIWQEIKEIKSDVKSLLAQSYIDKTRIDNLERQIFNAKSTSAVVDTHDSAAVTPGFFSVNDTVSSATMLIAANDYQPTGAYPVKGKYPPSPLSLILGEFIPTKNEEEEEKG